MLLKTEAYCPNNCLLNATSGKLLAEFFASAHVVETWVVDSKGGWIRTPNSGDGETTHAPDDQDVWTCTKCGTEAKFRKA